jgi:hypothetical protein
MSLKKQPFETSIPPSQEHLFHPDNGSLLSTHMQHKYKNILNGMTHPNQNMTHM